MYKLENCLLGKQKNATSTEEITTIFTIFLPKTSATAKLKDCSVSGTITEQYPLAVDCYMLLIPVRNYCLYKLISKSLW